MAAIELLISFHQQTVASWRRFQCGITTQPVKFARRSLLPPNEVDIHSFNQSDVSLKQELLR